MIKEIIIIAGFIALIIQMLRIHKKLKKLEQTLFEIEIEEK